MSKFYKLSVLKIEQLTPQAVKVTFRLPKSLEDLFHFEAGMYLTLQQTINNQKIRRAYSICSSVDEKELSVAIKRIPNGIFSTYATTILKEGDILEVMPPSGKFVFLPDVFGDTNIMLFSAGSGITPMLSIVKTALEKTENKVVLIYGNRTKVETLFLHEIERLKYSYSDRFFVEYVFSQECQIGTLTGRINDELIGKMLEKYEHLGIGFYYVCGPSEMINNVRNEILSREIPPECVFTEFFETLSLAKEEFLPQNGNVTITAIVDGKEVVFHSVKESNVLNSISNQGINVPYSCLNGVCSSCMAKILEGEVKMIKNETLVEKEILEGFVLTCQAYPITDTIKVTYDI